MRSSITFLILALTISLLSSPSLVLSAHAVVYRVGLNVGDTMNYQLTGNYGFFPSQPETQMKVLHVLQTNITAGFTDFFPDGPLSSNVYWVDVFTGQARNASSMMFFTVTPGLQVTDPIFNSSVIHINNMQLILCGGATRQVVVAQFVQANQNVAMAWDQNTGVLCRLTSSEYSYMTGSTPQSLNMAMTNTTLWGPNPNPVDAFAIAADITAFIGLPLVVLIVYVYFRKRSERDRSRR